MPVPARRAPFVGRTRELGTLLACLEEARHGDGAVALVAGESGIGKTRLLAEVVDRARTLGWTVLSGRASETAGMPPYLPFTEALQEYLHGRSADELLVALGSGAAEVARLLPQLRAQLPDLADLPNAPVVSANYERYRLFEGIAAALLGIARATESGLLLILDDLQWADASTLALIRHVVGKLATAPLVVALAYRTADPAITAPLQDVLAEVSRSGTAVHIPLRGFDAPETAALLSGLTGSQPAPQVTAAVQAATEGRPFFVGELARQLMADGRDLADPALADAPLGVPDGVQHVVARRLRQLSETANRMLQAAAVLDDGFTIAALQSTSDLALAALLDALDEALSAGIMQEQAGGFAFAHALIRRTLYDRLSLPRRQQLHLRAAEALEAADRGAVKRDDAAIAGHYRLSGALAPSDKALAVSRRMAVAAEAVFAWEEAAAHWRLAAEAMERGTAVTARDRCLLLLAWAATQARVSQNEVATKVDEQGFLPEQVLYRRAGEAARAADDADLLARSALGFAEATGWGKLHPTFIALLSGALAALGESDGLLRARCLGVLGEVLLWAGEPAERSRALTAEAVAMARRLGDPATLAHVLSSRHWTIMQPEHQAERAGVAAELSRLSASCGDLELIIRGYRRQLVDLLERGDVAAAAAALEAADLVAERLRSPCYQWYMYLFHAMLEVQSGDFFTLQTVLEPEGVRGAKPFPLWLFTLGRLRGCAIDAEPALCKRIDELPGIPAYRLAYALLLSETGREAEARAAFQAVLHGGLETIAHGIIPLSALTLLAELCAALHDEAQAAMVYRLLEPYGQLSASGYYAVDPTAGAVSRYLGLLAATLGRWDDAERHYQDAFTRNEQLGARIARAHTALQYAELLLARGARGDGTRAQTLLDDAVARYEQLGIPHFASKARLLRDGAGPRTAPARPTYPDGLSTREVEVLRLVAAGRTNPEIAAALVISLFTVYRHVNHILAKTGCNNRVEAATYAQRHGIAA